MNRNNIYASSGNRIGTFIESGIYSQKKKRIRIEHDCFSRSTSDSLLICPKTPVRTRHYIQVLKLNYAALKLNQISRKQLDPVQFDGEMCL